MGTIQKKSIQSSAIILFGFGIGAINLLIINPKVLSPEQFGLTRIITDAGLTLATLCTLGTLPVVYKFFPFYKTHLDKQKNDLPYITGVICLLGLVIMCFIGYLAKDVIVRKFSEKSPLFVEYSYLVYPYCILILFFMWLESFAISMHKSLLSNALRELAPRLFFTLILLLIGFKFIDDKTFYSLFSISFLIPALILFFALRISGCLPFVHQVSPVTKRLGAKMTNFGMFVFGAQFLNLLSRTVDTFILSAKSDRGLIDTAIFTLATYVVTLMEVPQRSITSVATPILAEAWKNKDLNLIKRIYRKSASNLLIIGIIMFALIWLNLHNIGGFLGKNFNGIETVILFMGIGKLIDLGTGANSQIIGTSSFWKVDFTTNVIYTFVALPLNYFLISKFGLMGAAYSTLISLTFYNAMRFGFLWFKFDMQPYRIKDLTVIIIAVVCIILVYLIPKTENYIIDAMIRTGLFMITFIPSIYFSNISEEINEFINKIPERFLKK